MPSIVGRALLVDKLVMNPGISYHGGQPVGPTVSRSVAPTFKNGVDSRALYPGASSEGSRQRSNTN